MKKTMAVVGIIASALLIVAGVLFMLGAFGGDGSYPGSASYIYDNGYANFGGDFYSYVNNNAADAASAARTTATNVLYVARMLKNFCGIVLIGMGMMGVCLFAILGCEKKAEKPAYIAPAVAPEAPVLPVAAEPVLPVDAPEVPVQPVQE